MLPIQSENRLYQPNVNELDSRLSPVRSRITLTGPR